MEIACWVKLCRAGKVSQFLGGSAMAPIEVSKVNNGWCKLHVPSTPPCLWKHNLFLPLLGHRLLLSIETSTAIAALTISPSNRQPGSPPLRREASHRSEYSGSLHRYVFFASSIEKFAFIFRISTT
jgi:hypothetical protein